MGFWELGVTPSLGWDWEPGVTPRVPLDPILFSLNDFQSRIKLFLSLLLSENWLYANKPLASTK